MSENKKEEAPKKEQTKQVAAKKQKEIVKDAEVLKLLQEDQDDFQQFEQGAYEQNAPAKVDAKQWRQDWDDEDMNDEFTLQLKKQLGVA